MDQLTSWKDAVNRLLIMDLNTILWLLVITGILLMLLIFGVFVPYKNTKGYKYKNLRYYLFTPKHDPDLFFVLPIIKIRNNKYYSYFGDILVDKDYDIICMAYIATPANITNDDELLEFSYNILNNKSDDE